MVLPDSQLENALAGFDPATAGDLLAVIQEPSFSGQLNRFTHEDAAQLLAVAAAFSIHPISGIAVGAIAVGQSGQLYLGANMEFPGVPLHATLHAEQSALLNAWMHEEHEVVALHVSETPCGHCRQFLRELSNIDRLKIHARGHAYSLEALLPHPFGEARAMGHGLLDSRPVALETARLKPDTSAQRVINAAQRSYTPYSRSPEGFMLECLDGHYFSGRAAECAAFNPSVPSVLVAFNQRNLSASRMVTITRATQAKLATAMNNPLPFARAVMQSISNTKINVVPMEVR